MKYWVLEFADLDLNKLLHLRWLLQMAFSYLYTPWRQISINAGKDSMRRGYYFRLPGFCIDLTELFEDFDSEEATIVAADHNQRPL